MTAEGILSDIKSLSLEEKISISASLQQMIKIEEKEDKFKKMVDKYVGTMTELVGSDFMKDRKRQHVSAKIVLAICFMEDGFSITTTSHIIGVDHSTVSSYKKSWENALRYPRQYSDMIQLYNNFRKAL